LTATPASRANSRWLDPLLRLCFYIAFAAAVAFLASQNASRYLARMRGVEGNPGQEAVPLDGSRLGTNVALERYTDDKSLRQVLGLVRAMGFSHIRQRFPWAELEPAPGDYRWQQWDRVLAVVQEYGLQVIAVLDTSPAWARPQWDADNPLAPPAAVQDYARFAQAFAQRYRGQVAAYQIWDEPNVSPHWGKGPIDPAGYVKLLQAASEAIRGVDASATIIAGGLAPNVEPGGLNMSDVVFLREIYRRGAGRYFDVLGVKAYGFWTGPEDRRVDPSVLNFSRVILLREEMTRRGEGHKPVWALEGGWCGLPATWQGRPSLQGSDRPFVQAERLDRALVRLQWEWPWMTVASLTYLQPNVSAENPLWGYALLDPNGQPQLTWERLYTLLGSARTSHYGPPTQNLQLDYQGLRKWLRGSILAGALAIALCLWEIWRAGREIPWQRAWGWVRARWLTAPDWLQTGVLLLSGLTAVLTPSLVGRLGFLALYSLCAALRPDLALLVAVACIPLAPLNIRLGPATFSLTEISILVAAAARLWEALLVPAPGPSETPRRRFPIHFSLLDCLVLLLVCLGLGTSFLAEYRRVAFRELRVIVAESALLYLLIRTARGKQHTLLQLADVLWLSGVGVALYALARYPFAEGVIEAETVRRARAFYGSPNNLALYLERLLPLGLAMAVWGRGRARRWVYGLGALPIALALFLTYSRGALFLGVPAMLLALAWVRGGRTRWIVLVMLVAVLIGLVLWVGPTRLGSLLDPSQGTTFLRLSLWQAAWQMGKDHPWLGVGLDNFLYYYGDYIRPGAEVDRWLSHPHNLVLDFWLRLGIGGVALILAMLAGFARKAFKVYRSLPDGDLRAMTMGLIAGMAACVAHGLIDSSFFVVELAFWFMFALAWPTSLPLPEEALTPPSADSILSANHPTGEVGR